MATMNQIGLGLSGSTGTGTFVGNTAPALLLPSANNFISGYATTATAGSTTTLVASSAYQQFFTGTQVQNVNMPVTSTLTVGQSWLIVNNSNQIVTVRSSGANNILAMPAGTDSIVTCIAQSGTTAADWNAEGVSGVAGVDSITGTANQVIASAATGAVTLSLPQDIATGSTPSFTGVNAIGGANFNAASGGGFVSQSPNNLSQLQLYSINNAAGYVNVLVNSATTAARTWTLPDASGTIALNTDGTFTPTLAFGGGSTGITYSNQWGFYTRVGNMVTIYIYLILTSKGSDTGAATIGGMPFSARTPTGNPPFPIYCENITFTGNPSPFMSGSTMILGNSVSGTSFAQWDDTSFTNSSDLIISGSYLIQ